MLHGADDPKRIGLLPGEKAPRAVPSFSKVNGRWNFEINWTNSIIVLSPPILVLAAALYGVPLTWPVALVGLVSYMFSGLGITGGYHRLFSHRSYNAHPVLEQIMGFAGAGALQGSIKWWCTGHRTHHNYIDTDMDPYNAKRGFWWSHVGWMLIKQDYGLLGYVDVSDLKANKYVQWQHKNYIVLALLSGVVLPTLAAGLLTGDWLGAFFYAALAKIACVHNSTFFINSLAHSPLLAGTQPFDKSHTAYDGFITSFLAIGEGMHNAHHSFPQNYANGVMWYDWDPTKWLIRSLEFVGLARNVVRVPNHVIERSRAAVSEQDARKALEHAQKVLASLDKKTATPDIWTWSDVTEKVNAGRKLMVVGDYVIDLEKPIETGTGYTHGNEKVLWSKVHPGGVKLLDAYIGKDATEAMTGAVYKHTDGAFNLLMHLRVASLKRE